ncbi:LysR family transcriptional regulator, partial [Priestia megaterium]
ETLLYTESGCSYRVLLENLSQMFWHKDKFMSLPLQSFIQLACSTFGLNYIGLESKKL